MRRYWSYLKYVIRHKWYVGIECIKWGLLWQAIFHDWDKFLPDEFIPYARYFYDKHGNIIQRRDSSGYYKPTDTDDLAFDMAWLLHQKRNKHHWQWWILPEDCGDIKVLEMPDKWIFEMICDWKGAGKAQGVKEKNGLSNWYLKNKDKMQLHPTTREVVEIYILPNHLNLTL